MTVIFIIIAVLFLVLLGWTWNSLGNVEKRTKIICIISGIVVVYIITLIIYNISKIGIVYENKDAMNLIQNVFVFLFAIINSYIFLPYIFKQIEKINNNNIAKNKLQKSIIILFIILIILAIFETSYLKSIQQGILNKSINF